jgi:probable rRNA maturation factor
VTVVEEGSRRASVKGLASWLSEIAPRSAHGEVTVAIVPDRKMKALNRTFRRMNKATDVLTFPSKSSRTSRSRPSDSFLGDIVIARGVAQKQAEILGHSAMTEFRVLALHGLLHLLGYDHEVDSGRMARVEARLRRRAGLPLGLIARSS